MEQADVVVIGSGQGGTHLAVKLAYAGNKVYVFERGALGGSCLNYGCYPSKAFLASAHLAGRARKAEDLGINVAVDADFSKVMERVRLLSGESGYIQNSFDEAGVNLVHAEASFAGPGTVSGGDVTVAADTVVINTGKNPFVPPIPGLEGTPYLTYLNFWQQTEAPRVMNIIGGGYIGSELGQGLARLGVEVRIIDIADRLIALEEPDVSETVMAALEADGVRFHLGTGVSAVRHDSGNFTLELQSGETVVGDGLMVATGQRANTDMLDADKAGVELDGMGNVRVDNRFRTTAEGVYAIGDVTGQPAFTHVSWEDSRRLLSIMEGGERTQGDRVLGYAFLTDPEVGRAGMTREQAQEKGLSVRVVELPLSRVARAYVSGQERGFFRLVANADDDKIVGATLVAPEAGELVHVFIDLIEAGATWQLLEQSVHIHQTLAEGLPTLARLLVDS